MQSEMEDDTRATIHVRQMEVRDLAPVFHLGERIFTEDVPNLYRTWDEFEVVRLFQSDCKFCFTAEKDDKIAGFIIGNIIKKAPSSVKYAHLVWMGVDPQEGRLGIAEKLFKRFLESTMSNGIAMMIVDTEADNLPAINFFQKMGFHNPQEHIYMSLNLPNEQVGVSKKISTHMGKSAKGSYIKNMESRLVKFFRKRNSTHG